MTEFKYKKENVILLIEMKIDSLKSQQNGVKKHEADAKYAKDVADLAKAGKVTQDDIMQLQNEGISKIDIMNISGHLVENATGLSKNEALQLGHKIQFIYMSYHQLNGRTDGNRLFAESMRPHEEGIDAIFDGTYPKEKLEILKSLPKVEKWNHQLGADAYHKIF